VLVTADGGASWTRPDLDDDRHLHAAAIPAEGHWIVAGEGGRLIASEDAGASWHEIATPYSGSFFGMLARSETDWLIFGLEGRLLETADGGETWRQIDTGQSSGLTAATRLADGRLVLVGLGGTILVEGLADGKPSGQLASRRLKLPTALSGVLAVDGDTVLLLGETGASRIDTPADPPAS
jgi:photosystem II stability/assembly factor-like uncharacterized protein